MWLRLSNRAISCRELLLAGDAPCQSHPPVVFLYLFILRDFKSNNLVIADSKGLAGPFFVSAYSKGLTNMDERQSIAPPNGNEPVSEKGIIAQLALPRCVFFAFSGPETRLGR